MFRWQRLGSHETDKHMGENNLSSKNMGQLVTGCSFKKEKMEIAMCNLQKIPSA